jgi:hypothetical protein
MEAFILNQRIRQLIIISIFVTICSRFSLHLNFLAEGFIVSLSIVMMAVFIYTYEDSLSALAICFVTGIISPGVRILLDFMDAPQLAAPDAAFFFVYGIIYTLIYKYIIREPRTIQTFPFVLAACDFVSNLVELTIRALVIPTYHINTESLLIIFMVAVLRSLLIQIIVVSIDYYSRILVDLEHDKEYKRLLTQTSIIESELYLMEKNTVEIEHIMKEAYDLNRTLREENVRHLRQNGRLYFLDRPVEAICPTKDRPLSRDRDALQKRYEERYTRYNVTADTRIPVNGDADTVAAAIREEFLI